MPIKSPNKYHSRDRYGLQRDTVKAPPSVQANFPPAFLPVWSEDKWIKLIIGGRSSGKSWGVARALLLWGQIAPLRILCAREYQSSISESVYELLVQQIYLLGLQDFYYIEKTSIFGKPVKYLDPETGMEKEKQTMFIFTGIANNVTKIRSMEGINIVWCEESHNISKYSLDILLPTIRSEGHIPGWDKGVQLIFTLNPESPDDEIYKRWLAEPEKNDDDVMIVKMNYNDNPWCPQTILKQAERMKLKSPEEYNWIFLGEPRRHMEGVIYAEQLRSAEGQGRITKVPYDPSAGVSAVFDLGISDETCIWFVQKCGFELHMIDYYANNQESMDHYMKVIADKPFAVDRIYLPHDAKAKQWGTGMSIEEMVRSKSKDNRQVFIVPRIELVDGISATRAMFGHLYFDKEKCADGLKSLRNYRYERMEGGGYRDYPKHDKWSHAADALRYCVTCIRSLEPRSKNQRKYSADREMFGGFGTSSTTNWMTV